MHGKIFLPPEIRKDAPRIILSGGEELLLEQHGGLFSYDSKCIRIRTGAGLLTVEGEKLVIDYFGVQDLMIRGKIQALRMDEHIK